MGEIADMMLEGTLCITCGVYFGNEPQGWPVQCEDCEADWKDPAAGKRTPDPNYDNETGEYQET